MTYQAGDGKSYSEFSVPPEGPEEGQGPSGEAAGVAFEPSVEELAPLAATYDGVDAAVREAMDGVAQAIQQQITAQSAGRPATVESLTGVGNLQGVTVGPSEPGGEGAPGEQVLHVYVAEPMAVDQVRSLLAEALDIRSARDVPIRVVHSGVMKALSGAFWTRPAPCGVSGAHYLNTSYGTLGCLARGRGDAANKVLCLSCNHVLARGNIAALGDCITQPAAADGGACDDRGRIAVLEKFKTINFSGKTNFMDCASGWCYPDRVRPELFYWQAGELKLFRIGNQPAATFANQWVGKVGRTSQVTYGQVQPYAWKGKITYYGNREAFFDLQLAIRNPGYLFSRSGDSGSIVWTMDDRRQPVAMIIAGSDETGITIATPIGWILEALSANLYT
ncbi:hypothetical protein AB0C51_03510 [Streptomyces pathocidini]|uniref:hypothetical protein n=1 Tax=Streptomyces pathocidini TaxID=1650571 RepID=UPI0033F9EAD1